MTEHSTTWLPAAHSRENGHFVFWAAAGLLQTGELDRARALIQEPA